MRGIPLEQERHDKIARRYVQICIEHAAPLDEGSLACPMPHPPGTTAEWFVLDLQTLRSVGGVCTQEDGDTGRPVPEEVLSMKELTPELKVQIRELYFKQKLPRKEIAAKLGLQYMQVYFQTRNASAAPAPKPTAPMWPAMVANEDEASRRARLGRPKDLRRKPVAERRKAKAKRTKKTTAIIATPTAPAPSLPKIQEDLAAYHGRLLQQVRDVERAMEAMAVVQRAWEGRQA